MSATQLKNGVRAWHEELLEFVLANPRASLAETALFFNVSISWVSIVKNSDAFQELWAKRRGEHFSRVSASVSERITALADVSLEALTARVEKEAREGTASINTLKEVGDMALRSLGFGNKHSVSPIHITTGGQTNIMVDRDTLARARESKARLHSQIGDDVPLSPLLIEGAIEKGEKIEGEREL